MASLVTQEERSQQDQAPTLIEDFMSKTREEGGTLIDEVIREDIRNGFYTADEVNESVLSVFDLENSILFGDSTIAGRLVSQLQYHFQNIFSSSELLQDHCNMDFVDTNISESLLQMNMNNIHRVPQERLQLHLNELSPNGFPRMSLMDWCNRIPSDTIFGLEVRIFAMQLHCYSLKHEEYSNLRVVGGGDKVDMYGKRGKTYFTHMLNVNQEELSEDDMEECICECFCLTSDNHRCLSWLHKTLFLIRNNERFRESRLFAILETIRHIFLTFLFGAIQRRTGQWPIAMWTERTTLNHP